MTLEAFAILVRNHDLTYAYSDDHNIWVRGERQLADINKAALTIPREDAVRIWNEQVDKVLMAQFRPQFYWKV